ncbi:hypothetical protein GRZ55_19300 [Chelativorans sp. ZYF759]|uniref:DUF6789 family protein n=1 Tax=Chelativorans sp. ZYF759 TaxID=2692213 RepID=UPI00145FB4DB|nr:DUF6789 family protein [Chelativorans sp. ZYF759]NMG41395.1 hypothetical protein [Chelativorans sp. ZYF759]
MSLARNLLRHLAILVFAGLAGLAIHLVLMGVKEASGILPEFQPYRDLQLLLGNIVPGALGSAMPYVTGAVIWGFVYARLHDFLPGRTALAKAATFATMAWLVMATAFFGLAGHGLFGIGLGRGLLPALFMLPMLFVFSFVLAMAHSRLRRIPSADRDAKRPEQS